MRSILLLSLMGGCTILNGAYAQSCKTASIPATTPNSRFTIHNNNTVTDQQTGLMWKQCLEGLSGGGCASGALLRLSWDKALQQAAGLNSSGGFVGYTDWRLPNIKELESILESQCVDPAINMDVFPSSANNASTSLWSASAHAHHYKNSEYTWFVNFRLGYAEYSSRNVNFSVRLVRSGQ